MFSSSSGLREAHCPSLLWNVSETSYNGLAESACLDRSIPKVSSISATVRNRMHTGGKEYRRSVGAFERVFGATILFGTDAETSRAKVIQRSRFNFMNEAQIWYSRTPGQRVLSSEFENIVVLATNSTRR